MSRTQTHLRNRSSVSAFGSQPSIATPDSLAAKHRLNQAESDADRVKFQSFKFPRIPSISSSSSSSSSFSSLRSLAFSDTDSSSSSDSYNSGLPTPPPSATGVFTYSYDAFPGSEFSSNFKPPMVKELSYPSTPSSPPHRFAKREYRDDNSPSYNASVDLRSMEESFIIEDTFDEEYASYNNKESFDVPPRWYSYQPPSPEPINSFRKTTFRVKQGVMFRTRSLPSTTVVRMLRWGSWVAMVILIVLAVFFVFRIG